MSMSRYLLINSAGWNALSCSWTGVSHQQVVASALGTVEKELVTNQTRSLVFKSIQVPFPGGCRLLQQ